MEVNTFKRRDIVGKNEKVIKKYIQNQLQEDKLYDQIEFKGIYSPIYK